MTMAGTWSWAAAARAVRRWRRRRHPAPARGARRPGSRPAAPCPPRAASQRTRAQQEGVSGSATTQAGHHDRAAAVAAVLGHHLSLRTGAAAHPRPARAGAGCGGCRAGPNPHPAGHFVLGPSRRWEKRPSAERHPKNYLQPPFVEPNVCKWALCTTTSFELCYCIGCIRHMDVLGQQSMAAMGGCASCLRALGVSQILVLLVIVIASLVRCTSHLDSVRHRTEWRFQGMQKSIARRIH
jgi:hypothetical protein